MFSKVTVSIESALKKEIENRRNRSETALDRDIVTCIDLALLIPGYLTLLCRSRLMRYHAYWNKLYRINRKLVDRFAARGEEGNRLEFVIKYEVDVIPLQLIVEARSYGSDPRVPEALLDIGVSKNEFRLLNAAISTPDKVA